MPRSTMLTVRRWLLLATAVLTGPLVVAPLWNSATTARAGLLGAAMDTTAEVSVTVDEAELRVAKRPGISADVQVTTSESPTPSASPEPSEPAPTPAPRQAPAPAPGPGQPEPAPRPDEPRPAAPPAEVASERSEPTGDPAPPGGADASDGAAQDPPEPIEDPDDDETLARSDGLTPIPLSAARARSEMAGIPSGQQDLTTPAEPMPDENRPSAGREDAQAAASPAPRWDRGELLQFAGATGLGLVALGLLALLLFMSRAPRGRRGYQPRHARSLAERSRSGY